MCAQFKDVTPLLQEQGLVPPTFNLLVADNALYDVLAIQPAGRIEVRPDFIGPHDQAAANAKFARFLTLAAQRQPDLVLSPEYSCPWTSIASAIQNNLLPAPGKLWALGAESITRGRLDELKAAHPQVKWLHEPYPAKPGQFFDPAVYIFTAASAQGAPCIVVLVQFKTEAMAGTIERDGLIPGNTFYYFHNQQDLIRLLTIICSESMGFKPENSGSALLHKHAYVILHPQLNPEPRHGAMSEYRNWLYLRRVSDGQDILTLNWASGFTFTVGNKPPSKYGGSTIYTKASHFDRTDARLEANHRKGLYYVRGKSDGRISACSITRSMFFIGKCRRPLWKWRSCSRVAPGPRWKNYGGGMQSHRNGSLPTRTMGLRRIAVTMAHPPPAIFSALLQLPQSLENGCSR